LHDTLEKHEIERPPELSKTVNSGLYHDILRVIAETCNADTVMRIGTSISPVELNCI